MPAPKVYFTSIDKYKISDESGMTKAVATIIPDKNIRAWESRANGIYHGSGLLLGKSDHLFPTSETYPGASTYPRDYLHSVSQYLPNEYLTQQSSYSPSWDTTKNPHGIKADGFSGGYNGGVTSPEKGYHAHLRPDKGPDSGACFDFIDRNSEVGLEGRWMGISQHITGTTSNLGWSAGSRVLIAVDLWSDNIDKPARCGLYHKSISSGGNTFGNQIKYFYPDMVREWHTVYKEVTIDDDYDLSQFTRLYMYGHYGPEGNFRIANPRVILLDSAEITFDVQHSELQQDDIYRVNVYAVSDDSGEWNSRDLRKVRYIRDWLGHGSTSNSGNHWIEIKAFDANGNNVALGAYAVNSAGGEPTDLTDGSTDTAQWSNANMSGGSLDYQKVDLGQVYELENITVWHYYGDNRTYYKTKTEVSLDDSTWETVFDSEIEGEYTETSSGNEIKL